MTRKSGLADSPFFSKVAPEAAAAAAQDPGTEKLETLTPEPLLPVSANQWKTISVAEETMQASKQASLQANLQTNKQASLQARKHAGMQANVQVYLTEKVDNIATFRYPVGLLEKLEDVIHQIRKEQRKKVTKQAVAVAALAFLLTDFEDFGEESVLFQLLLEPDS